MSRSTPHAQPLIVDGHRPAASWVAALPQSWTNDGERIVLLLLALDTRDGSVSAPGREQLASWSGHWPSSNDGILKRLATSTGERPALIEIRPSKGRYRTRYRLRTEVQPPDAASGLNVPATSEGSQTCDPEHPPGVAGGLNTPVLSEGSATQPPGEPPGEPPGDARSALALAPTNYSSSPHLGGANDDRHQRATDEQVHERAASIRRTLARSRT